MFAAASACRIGAGAAHMGDRIILDGDRDPIGAGSLYCRRIYISAFLYGSHRTGAVILPSTRTDGTVEKM